MTRLFVIAALSGALIGSAGPARSADLTTTLETMGQFDRFIEAARSVGVYDELREGGVYCANGCTVFAPTDEAFAGVTLPDDDLAARAIIEHHILPQPIRIADIVSRQGETLAYDQSPLAYSGIASRDLTVGGARVVRGDVDAINGVIHIVDQVSLP